MTEENKEKKTKGCSPIWIIILVISLGVGIVMLAILAAIALPMYTRFKQKVTAAEMVKQTVETASQLETFYSNVQSFDSITIDGTDLIFQEIVIATMPTSDKATWVIGGEQNDIRLRWTSTDPSCPDQVCSGILCLHCADGNCTYQVTFASPDIGMDQGDGSCTY